MIVRGKLLRHLSEGDPEPVDLEGMEITERMEDGKPFPYPVHLNFDQSKHIGFAHVVRDEDGDLTARCHIHDGWRDQVEGQPYLAAGFSLMKIERHDGKGIKVARSKLLEVSTTTRNVDPTVTPWEEVTDAG